MIVVRQWMTNSFKTHTLVGFVFTLSLLSLVSCNPTELPATGQRSNVAQNDASLINKAYVYRESPYFTEGENYGPDANMKGSVDQDDPEFITDKNNLKTDCQLALFNGSVTIQDCIHGFAGKSAAQQVLSRQNTGNWIYAPNTSEFYQVNGLYHVKHATDTFFEKLGKAYDNLHSHPSLMWKTKQLPYYLPQTGMFWFQAITTTPNNDNYFKNNFLSNYALCNFDQNASFSPAGPELCMGNWSAHPSFFLVQDPSVVYHEMGHALIAIMMNTRNAIPNGLTPSFHALRSNLNAFGYDEAGSLGEGIADYFSFVMNKRTHMGEWGLGFADSSRPMSESDPMHIAGIDTTPEGRLSYPQYILYDPNRPNVPFEDIHYAGQIVSHYLVALTKSLQTECSMSSANAHDDATSYVMLLLAETFAELGDLRSVGLDTSWGAAYNPSSFTYRFNNLDENASFMWAQVVNPPTYRKFFQIFSKNILKYVTGGLCAGFTQDESEKLLDDYGLLLFKTYNNDGSSTKSKHIQYSATGTVGFNVTPTAPTPIHESNRRKSVLISKELISMAEPDAERDVSSYYIIDDQASMTNIVQSLLFKGYPMNSTNGVASVEYNNANIKISPGEVVAIIPNLFNSSNSAMAGVQLLANDWDHVNITDTTGINGHFAPCEVDSVTTQAQGAEPAATCSNTLTEYRRHVKNTSGFFRTDEVVAPVCLVELEDGDVTRWVSQNEFRKKQGLALQDKDCLGYGGTAYTEDFTFTPHECLVRASPAANKAFYSRIDAQKSYSETVRNGNAQHKFNVGNVIIFEVNKWIPPGTKFRCRLRARFSNCSDCFSDPTDTSNDDYIDAELNGSKPYQIINFEFEVND